MKTIEKGLNRNDEESIVNCDIPSGGSWCNTSNEETRLMKVINDLKVTYYKGMYQLEIYCSTDTGTIPTMEMYSLETAEKDEGRLKKYNDILNENMEELKELDGAQICRKIDDLMNKSVN